MIKHIFIRKPATETRKIISDLSAERIVTVVTDEDDNIIVGLWGTNKSALKKLLEKHKQEK